MSIANRGTLAGIAEMVLPLGRTPDLNVFVIALKSCSSLHPLELFFMENTEVLHGLLGVGGQIDCSIDCSISCVRVLSFSLIEFTVEPKWLH